MGASAAATTTTATSSAAARAAAAAASGAHCSSGHAHEAAADAPSEHVEQVGKADAQVNVVHDARAQRLDGAVQ
jgi:hypothetical protein